MIGYFFYFILMDHYDKCISINEWGNLSSKVALYYSLSRLLKNSFFDILKIRLLDLNDWIFFF